MPFCGTEVVSFSEERRKLCSGGCAEKGESAQTPVASGLCVLGEERARARADARAGELSDSLFVLITL